MKGMKAIYSVWLDVKSTFAWFFSFSYQLITNGAAPCAQVYYYAETQTTHITYPDGMEVLHFANNQTGESRWWSSEITTRQKLLGFWH